MMEGLKCYTCFLKRPLWKESGAKSRLSHRGTNRTNGDRRQECCCSNWFVVSQAAECTNNDRSSCVKNLCSCRSWRRTWGRGLKSCLMILWAVLDACKCFKELRHGKGVGGIWGGPRWGGVAAWLRPLTVEVLEYAGGITHWRKWMSYGLLAEGMRYLLIRKALNISHIGLFQLSFKWIPLNCCGAKCTTANSWIQQKETSLWKTHRSSTNICF